MTGIYFDTLAGSVDGAEAAAANARAIFARPTDLWNLVQDPLNYGQTRTADIELLSLKGKPTRKYFHVVLWRLDSGRYELTTYIL